MPLPLRHLRLLLVAFALGLGLTGSVQAQDAVAVDSVAQGTEVAHTIAAAVAPVEAEKPQGVPIIHHITNSDEIEIEVPFGHPIHIPLAPHFNIAGFPLGITKHVVMMWIAALLLLIVLPVAARNYNPTTHAPRGKLTNLIETFVQFIRDELVLPNIGKEGHKLMPYFLTVFFFILFCNLLGLIPFFSTATGNVNVTLTLAAITFIVTQVQGMKKNGVGGYLVGLVPHGVPTFVIPLMAIVEFVGLFTKPFALTIRLFANMTAGHVIILSLLGLGFILQSYAVMGIGVIFSLLIYLLELFVAFLQAYVFTMLSALFVGMAIHQEH